MSSKKPSPAKKANLQTRGVTLDDLNQFVSYAEFKRLFDNMDHLLKTRAVKSLSCLSFQAGEGKSFVTSAIALGMTKMLGYRVLLVDASNQISDWTISDIFSHRQTDFIEQEGMVYSVSPNLDVIQLSGLATVAHKAQEYRVQDIILEYKNRYDLIMFDSAALRSANRGNFDPWVIASRTDGSILIVSGKAGDLSQSFQVEPILKSKVIGVIENVGIG